MVKFGDINPFALALTDPAGYHGTYPTSRHLMADINCDGAVNAFDIDPFVKCTINHGCPCVATSESAWPRFTG